MNIAQKKDTVTQLAQTLKDKHVYFANSEGLHAASIGQLRSTCHQAGITYRVVKNTLLLRALKEVQHPTLDLDTLEKKVLKGPTSLFIIGEDPSRPAKLLQTFHKKNKEKRPHLKAAFAYDELYVGEKLLAQLTQLKSKEQLLAEVLQALQAPMHNLLSALQAPQNNLAGCLKTLAENPKKTS